MERQRVKSNHSSHVANAVVVAAAEDAADQGALTQPSRTSLLFRPGHPGKTQSSTEVSTSGMKDIRSRLTERGFSSDATSVMLNCWRPITQRVCNNYIQKWEKYATEMGIRSSLPSVVQCVIP